MMDLRFPGAAGVVAFMLSAWPVAESRGARGAHILDVPDYAWHAGCFGTACGNLFGFWDRNGFPNFYTGRAGDGVAPLNDHNANVAIHSMWASQAGLDGRPAAKPGHMEDYYVDYESTAPDPYRVAQRKEHEPDCIGDFIGMNQNKWTNLNEECDGNIDAFSFVFWDTTGAPRRNFLPTDSTGNRIPDIPSGLLAWSSYRGYQADVVSQLVAVNPTVSPGKGFTFEQLVAEIDAGYPVLLFLQRYREKSRHLGPLEKANPEMHGMLAYGYLITEDGTPFVRFRTSWASGDNTLNQWGRDTWFVAEDLPVRGVICYRPYPKITGAAATRGRLTLSWDGPAATLQDDIDETTFRPHVYVVERGEHLDPARWTAVTEPSNLRSAEVPILSEPQSFYRVRLLPPLARP